MVGQIRANLKRFMTFDELLNLIKFDTNFIKIYYPILQMMTVHKER
ncbi:hypothetical protein SOHN41_01933 [Shewanella sp. HN-41]|nr:hypothetical protein SOHN41_01933 [Shewanella sp. HN-41]